MIRRILIPAKLRQRFLRTIKRPSFLAVLVILLLAGDWLGNTVVFEPPAKWLGDILLRTRDAEQARITRIVRIEAGDRDKVLGAAIVNAVSTLMKSSPALVVVDIDTSSAAFEIPEMAAPVIWAVDADWELDNKKLNLKSARFLGRRLGEMPPIGIARMPTGFDGVVRGWQHSFEVNGHETPSLVEEVLQRYCGSKQGCRRGGEPYFTRDYQFAPVKLSEFVPVHGEGDPRLANKIVVLGGFHPGADRHDTPWGTKFGAELVAMAIEEELNPNGLGHLPKALKWVLKILLALCVAALHHYFRPLAATVLTVVFLPVAVLLSGLVMFWSGDYELAVVPLVAGILVEQLATAAEKGEHWVKHVEEHAL